MTATNANIATAILAALKVQPDSGSALALRIEKNKKKVLDVCAQLAEQKLIDSVNRKWAITKAGDDALIAAAPTPWCIRVANGKRKTVCGLDFDTHPNAKTTRPEHATCALCLRLNSKTDRAEFGMFGAVLDILLDPEPTPPAHEQTKPDSRDSREELAHTIIRSLHPIDFLYAKLSENSGVTVAERRVLEALRGEPINVPTLARRLDLDRQCVQNTVNGLLASGLLVHKPNPAHLRSNLLELTPEAVRAINLLRFEELKILDEATAKFSTADVANCLRVLQHLTANLPKKTKRNR